MPSPSFRATLVPAGRAATAASARQPEGASGVGGSGAA
jgi:hypothetical protein